jgi:hypothetical protein
MPLLGVLGGALTIATDGMWRPEHATYADLSKSMPIVRILACCMVFLFTDLASAADPPIELRYLGLERDEHWNTHSLWMKLSNHSDKPRWFLLPWSGNRPLPEKTIFPDDKILETPLGMTIFDVKGEMVAIGVSFGSTFRAFHLPAQTVLEIPEYNISSNTQKTEFSEMVVVEANELLVNGKVPLEKWIPFEVGVFKEEMLPSGVGKKAKLESEKATASRKEHPGKKVEYIEAQGVRRWTVKFQPKGKTR